MIDLMENTVLRGLYVRGESGLLRTMLEDTFGPLPPWALDKFVDASEEQIFIWARRVRKAESLQAVFA